MKCKACVLAVVLFGFPFLLNMLHLLNLELLFGAAVNRMHLDETPVDYAFSAADIAFGGDKAVLVKTYKRLLRLTAGPGDGRVNRSLTVAVVNISNERRTVEKSRAFGIGPEVSRTSPRPIAIDLANAGDGAVVLIANRPVVWSAEHSQE